MIIVHRFLYLQENSPMCHLLIDVKIDYTMHKLKKMMKTCKWFPVLTNKSMTAGISSKVKVHI